MPLESAVAVATIAGPFVALAVGAAQVWIVHRGIAAMTLAGDRREKREDTRHAESMEALRALIRGMEHQGAALERQGVALERQGAALERQGAAFEAALKGGRI